MGIQHQRLGTDLAAWRLQASLSLHGYAAVTSAYDEPPEADDEPRASWEQASSCSACE